MCLLYVGNSVYSLGRKVHISSSATNLSWWESENKIERIERIRQIDRHRETRNFPNSVKIGTNV